jgi:DNA-binding NtrC family response regulator
MPKRIKALVADSDLDMLSKMYLTLLHKGYRVEATNNAEEILARIERFKPNVLVLSASLYNLSDKIYQQINQKRTPVLLITDHHDLDFGLKKFEIFDKPKDLHSIDSKIKELINILV